ncbi:NAD(P)-dependent oxidoreductase [Priestia taiwanensis]|uniref:Oxidoreductase n=1 Tax=Priestia taiwanensis TaxID=1347902 RepID=A0A917ELP1_9BACI|nr:NAD(P)H-binding protein [Priestia taiwanensis]MBM7362258.1 putative NADH-flavin reductase [Priestia taiwanensis]GGE60763.1 oxidoreductase [Priestia taiwanensis]
MKICILGSTGRVGSELLQLALQDSHDIKVLVRDKNRLTVSHRNLHIIEGNVLDENDVKKVLKETDIVISALGTDGNGTLSKCMLHIIKHMKEEEIGRIITIGTAGILQARTNPKIYRFQSEESKRRSTTAAEDHLAAYLSLKSSGLCWTNICPTHLIDGEKTGTYRTEVDMLPLNGSKITVGDTAHFTWSLVKKEGYENSRVGIAY